MSCGPVGLEGVGVGTGVGVGVGVDEGVLEEGVCEGVLEEGVGVGVLEEDDDEMIDEELPVEDAEDMMSLAVETAVDEELGKMVEDAGTRVSRAKSRQDQQSFGSRDLRPTIHIIAVTCTVVLVLDIAISSTLTTRVTGGYALSVICTSFVAALKALGVHVGEVATIIICLALQSKGAAISTRVRATVILGAGVACWTACGASRVVWWRSRSPCDNRCANHIFTRNVSFKLQFRTRVLLGLR